eukprot:COSAG02_NODE_24291_length_692_cov_1.951096_2_plen_44_part_01
MCGLEHSQSGQTQQEKEAQSLSQSNAWLRVCYQQHGRRTRECQS